MKKQLLSKLSRKKVKKATNRLLALVLTAFMLTTILPIMALADSIDNDDTEFIPIDSSVFDFDVGCGSDDCTCEYETGLNIPPIQDDCDGDCEHPPPPSNDDEGEENSYEMPDNLYDFINNFIDSALGNKNTIDAGDQDELPFYCICECFCDDEYIEYCTCFDFCECEFVCICCECDFDCDCEIECLYCEIDADSLAIEPMMAPTNVSTSSVDVTHAWSFANADAVAPHRIGAPSGNAYGALKLEIPPEISEDFENIASVELVYTIRATANNRRLVAWTNTSRPTGTEDATGFPTGNLAALNGGNVLAAVWGNPIASTSYSLTSDQIATFFTTHTTHLYLMMITDNPDANVAANQRPADLGLIESVTINITHIVPQHENVLYDMQTDAGLTNQDSASNIGRTFITSHNTGNIIVRDGAGGKEIVLSGRGGAGQSVAFQPSAITTKPGHDYRFEYEATFSQASAPRWRFEGGGYRAGQTTDGASVNVGTTFKMEYTLSAANVALVGTGRLSATAAVNGADITYTALRIIAICPPGCEIYECNPCQLHVNKVWELDFSRLNTQAGSTGARDTLVGTGYNSGVQKVSSADHSIFFNQGDRFFRWTATNVNREIEILRDVSDGFVGVNGREYRVEFEARSSSTIHIRGNQTSANGQTTISNLSASSWTPVVATWIEDSSTTFRISMVSAASLDIRNLRIYDVTGITAPCTCPESPEWRCHCDSFEATIPTGVNIVPGAGFNYSVTQQNWSDYQRGWEWTTTNSSDTSATLARREGTRYLYLEFAEPPGDFTVTVQSNATTPSWQVYHIRFWANRVWPAGSSRAGQPMRTAGQTIFIIDFENDTPPDAVGQVGAARAGYSIQQTLHAPTMQMIIDSSPTSPASADMDFTPFVSGIKRGFFTNQEGLNQIIGGTSSATPITEGLTIRQATGSGSTHPVVAVETLGIGSVSFTYNFTSTNIAQVRLQYSYDEGVTWFNLSGGDAVINTAGSPTRSVILPADSCNRSELLIRWVPHGPVTGWNNWGSATFTVSNPQFTSGYQIGQGPSAMNPIISMSATSATQSVINQRAGAPGEAGGVTAAVPGFTLREGATGVELGVTWLSSNTDIVRAASAEPTAIANIRGLRPGQANIRVASVQDPTIFNSFNMTVSAIAPPAPRDYTITSPYAGVNWGSWGQYKAAHHTHSWASDGNHSTAQMAERHYQLGFNIVSFTDHNRPTSYAHLNRDLGGSPMNRANAPPTQQRIERMAAGWGRGGNGMVTLTGTNEPGVSIAGLGDHHVNLYFANGINRTGSGQLLSNLLGNMRTAAPDGIARLNHPGRYTGAQWSLAWDSAKALSSSSRWFMPYVGEFIANHDMVGMEVINKFDSESQADRVLWDSILSHTMPQGRAVWGFSDDDSHSIEAVGYSYNIMLMPELTIAHVRDSMIQGSFLAFTRVDREYGIYPDPITSGMWDGTGSLGALGAHNLSTPRVNSIQAGNNRIEINATLNGTRLDSGFVTMNDRVGTVNNGVGFIDWYADGIKIHSGHTLNLNDYQLDIYSYVRATIVTVNGVIYTQPFHIAVAGTPSLRPELTGVAERSITVSSPTGAPISESGLRLPLSHTVTTSAGPRQASVRWDLSTVTAVYNPQRTNINQTFTINGTILLGGMNNTAGVSRTITATVTVNRVQSVTTLAPLVDFGSNWRYTAAAWEIGTGGNAVNPPPTHINANGNPINTSPQSPQITNAATGDIQEGWGQGVAPIGFPTALPANLPEISNSNGTVIPTGIGLLSRFSHGTRLWSGYAFTRTFDLPAGFNADDILEFGGTHRISDGFIIFVNGVEVYRYFIGPSTSGNTAVTLGLPVNFTATRGHNNSSRAAANVDFSIAGENLTVPWAEAAVWSEAALRGALQAGTNVITVIQSRGQGSDDVNRPLYFDIEFGSVLDCATCTAAAACSACVALFECDSCGTCAPCLARACDCANPVCSYCFHSCTDPSCRICFPRCACPCADCTYPGHDCRELVAERTEVVLESVIKAYNDQNTSLMWFSDGGGYYQGLWEVDLMEAIVTDGNAAGFAGANHAAVLAAIEAEEIEVTVKITNIAGGTGVLSGLPITALGSAVYHEYNSAPWWTGGTNEGFEEIGTEVVVSLNVTNNHSSGNNDGSQITATDRNLGLQISIADTLIANGVADNASATISFEIIDARVLGPEAVLCDCACHQQRRPGGGGGGSTEENNTGSPPGLAPSDDDITPRRTTVQTVPGNGIPIPYSMIDGRVTLMIDAALTQELIDAATNGMVSFNLTGVPTAIQVVLPPAALEAFVEAGLGLEISLPQGKISLDAAALTSLVDQMGGQPVTITLYKPETSDLSASQQSALEDDDAVFRIRIEAAGVFIREFDGVITVTLPYDGPFPAKVYYIALDGDIEEKETEHSESAGTVTFKTDHLSIYVIRHISHEVQDVIQEPGVQPQPEGPPPRTIDDIIATAELAESIAWWLAIVSAAGFITAGVLTVILIRRKRAATRAATP
ncbi:MAG: hypothetical protein LBC71_00035 [Oscillospiraceae bacterium]|jgi:hypothetical protein|nr:hypothetical protein [Oscillospiraceae bacterium]